MKEIRPVETICLAARDCGDARKALRGMSLPAAIDWMCEHQPGWLLRGYGVGTEAERALVSPQRLDECAKAEPRAALAYAAQHLSPQRLDECAKERPWDALRYAAQHLSKKRIKECLKIHPEYSYILAAKKALSHKVTKKARKG